MTDFARWSLCVTQGAGHVLVHRYADGFSIRIFMITNQSECVWGTYSMKQHRQLELVKGLGRGLTLRDPQHVETNGFG